MRSDGRGRAGDEPRVAVCAGKDCRTRVEFDSLCTDLGRVASIDRVRCLGLCDSPVVVLEPESDRPVVLEKVRSEKQRRDVVAVVADGAPLTARLKSRRPKRTQRDKALRRLRRGRAA